MGRHPNPKPFTKADKSFVAGYVAVLKTFI
jgi:hypothetical protein